MTNILLTSAMQIESWIIKKKLGLTHNKSFENISIFQNNSKEKNISLLITGVGPAKSRKSLDSALQFLKPDIIINSGSAGALSDGLVPGQIILPKIVMDDSGNKMNIPENANITRRLSTKMGIADRKYTLITRAKPVKNATRKREIYQSLDADLVDMEAFPQAQLAASISIPFLCIKVISDRANHFAFIDYFRSIYNVSKVLSIVFQSLLLAE